MPLDLNELVTLAPRASELLREIRYLLVGMEWEPGSILHEIRSRVIQIRDVDSPGGRRITKKERQQLFVDIRHLGLHAISSSSGLLTSDQSDVRKLAIKCYKFAFDVVAEIND